jgi:hypothetical protein
MAEVNVCISDRGYDHISTRQIHRLLDEAAEGAGLQETRPGNVRQRKMIKRQFTCGLDRTIEERHMKRQALINCSIHVDDSFRTVLDVLII